MEPICTKCGWQPTLPRDPDEKFGPKGKGWCPICQAWVEVHNEPEPEAKAPEPEPEPEAGALEAEA